LAYVYSEQGSRHAAREQFELLAANTNQARAGAQELGMVGLERNISTLLHTVRSPSGRRLSA